MTWGAFLAAKAPFWQGRQTFAIVDPSSSLAPPLRRLPVSAAFSCAVQRLQAQTCAFAAPRASDSSAAEARQPRRSVYPVQLAPRFAPLLSLTRCAVLYCTVWYLRLICSDV